MLVSCTCVGMGCCCPMLAWCVVVLWLVSCGVGVPVLCGHLCCSPVLLSSVDLVPAQCLHNATQDANHPVSFRCCWQGELVSLVLA